MSQHPDNTARNSVLPVDTVISGDAALPGLAQPYTIDNIRDIYITKGPVRERVQALQRIRSELVSRATLQTDDGFQGLIAEVDRGLDILSGSPSGFADPDVLRKTTSSPSQET